MYNLDGRVDGLDVVDFPGVDDRDETIPDLAELLLFLAQIVIFVVEYKYVIFGMFLSHFQCSLFLLSCRRVHTESAKKWLSKLQEGGVPVLVCLTFADKLYAEVAEQICGKDSEEYPPGAEVKHRLEKEMKVWILPNRYLMIVVVRLGALCPTGNSEEAAASTVSQGAVLLL